MKQYSQMNSAELSQLQSNLSAEFSQYCKLGRKLNMTRGVPSNEQLQLCSGMLSSITEDDYTSANGTDCRNYGGVDGILEMKRIFADILGADTDEVVVGGNSSLALMFDSIAMHMSHGAKDGAPWQSQGQVKFLCPSPGYDRHFAICKYFNIEMIPVSMDSNGPDMDAIEAAIEADPMIKGIWCVPRFSNPTGIVYSDDTVHRFARLKPAADDFRIFWDNAYAMHAFDDSAANIPSLIRLCEEAGNSDMPLVFSSFSKISFAGAAVSCVASSKANCEHIRKRLTIQTIGPDKLNQLRHVRFFKDFEGVLSHMKKHAAILAPKFKLVSETLRSELGGLGIAQWTEPLGGYFVSFDALEGCAKRIVSLCADAGVALTPAGATYPNGSDPTDQNIRIAPSYPPLPELDEALKIFCVAVKLACVEKYLAEK